MNKKRLQFDFAVGALERLDALVDETHSASRAELVRRALQIFDRLHQLEKAGGKLQYIDNTGKTSQIILV